MSSTSDCGNIQDCSATDHVAEPDLSMLSHQLSQSLVSHHLRLLRSARLVRGERKGKYIFYSIMDHHVSHVLQDMVFHIAEE